MHVEEFAPYPEWQTNEVETSDGRCFSCSQWSDIIHLHDAESIASYLHDYYANTPALTRHSYGQGVGVYVGTTLDEEGLKWLLDRVTPEAKVRVSAARPRGVELIQRSADTRTWLFALNFADQPVEITLDRSGRDLISGRSVEQSIVLGPNDVAIVESTLS